MAATPIQHAPAPNTAAVVTLSKDESLPISSIWLAYSDKPVGVGSIKVEDEDGVVLWGPFPIADPGLQQVTFDPPLVGTKNKDMVITLSAGGLGISGILAVNAGKRT